MGIAVILLLFIYYYFLLITELSSLQFLFSRTPYKHYMNLDMHSNMAKITEDSKWKCNITSCQNDQHKSIYTTSTLDKLVNSERFQSSVQKHWLDLIWNSLLSEIRISCSVLNWKQVCRLWHVDRWKFMLSILQHSVPVKSPQLSKLFFINPVQKRHYWSPGCDSAQPCAWKCTWSY